MGIFCHFRMELRCVIAVIRHGDRTPKQKMKMEVRHQKYVLRERTYYSCVISDFCCCEALLIDASNRNFYPLLFDHENI